MLYCCGILSGMQMHYDPGALSSRTPTAKVFTGISGGFCSWTPMVCLSDVCKIPNIAIGARTHSCVMTPYSGPLSWPYMSYSSQANAVFSDIIPYTHLLCNQLPPSTELACVL